MISTFSRILNRILLFYQPSEDPLPPLLLTAEEASTLYLATRLMEAYAEGRRADEAARVQPRIIDLLPMSIRAETELLGDVVGALIPAHHLLLDDPKLLALQRAIEERRVVRIVYSSYGADEPAAREVEPHALHFRGGVWYLNGYCHEAQSQRLFRLTRMQSIRMQGVTFEPRFTSLPADVPITIRVRFEPEVLMQVREQQHDSFRHEEPALGQRTRIMSYEVDTLDELVSWLLSWGASAEVLEPEELREVIHQEAVRMAQRNR